MNWSSFVRFKNLSIFAVALTAASIAGCGENLGAGQACPLLCPPESAPLKDTIVDAVVLDTSATGFPAIGFEETLVLAHRADSLDTRVITRFDSLPQTYKYQNNDSAIVRMDSAFIRAPRLVSDTAAKFSADGRFEVYDVTDAANDTAVADLNGQFTAANKIGELPYAKGDSPDTLKIFLDPARVLSRLQNGRNLRIGLRMVSTGSDVYRIPSTNTASGIKLTLIPSSASLATPVAVNPATYSPLEPSLLRFPLLDFQITVVGASPAVNVLRVGGAPAHRVLMRFDIPSRIVDSTVVVRASLLLTQRPSTAAEAGDTVSVQIVPVGASVQATDLRTQLEFAQAGFFPVDSLLIVPKDSGVVSIEMVRLVRAWKGQNTTSTPRVAALFLTSEGQKLSSFDFFSTEAPQALRPRLRITYVPRVNSGQP
jgi:hypothetical protein